uniref:ShKT domain-containing protein n=1 Tax=Plectus sambesii TaxID=2011161 RepID=A0A914WQJ3_9BILA
MLRVFLCLLIATSSYADLDIGSAVGGVVDKEVSGAVKDGVSGVVGDEIGGQIGDAAGELAGSVVQCYIDGILTTGKGCPDADLEAAAGKAAGDLLGDLGDDLKNAADKEIDKVAGSISNGIGGELGNAVGGAVGDALKDVVKDVAAADKSTDCVTMKSYCKNAFYEKMMAEMCPKTCGASGSAAPAQPAATPAPAPVTSAPAPAAVDKTPQCASMKAYCNNASYKKMMTEQCPKTCGITTPPTSSGSTSTGTSGSSASGSTGTGSSSSGTSGSTSGSGSSSSGTSGSTSGSGSSSSGTSGSSSSSSSGSSSSSSGVKQEAPCTNEGGMCKFDTDCSDGTLKSGLCPTQAANIKCCVPKSGSSGSEAPVTAGGYGKGVDVSDLTTVEQFNCLKKEGFNLAIVRVYRNANGGSPDTNALTTMKNAKAAGFYVEIYHFPNPSKNGATQFDEMYNHVTGGR